MDDNKVTNTPKDEQAEESSKATDNDKEKETSYIEGLTGIQPDGTESALVQEAWRRVRNKPSERTK